MRSSRFVSLVLLACLLGVAASSGRGQNPAPSAEEIEFFEKRVRPILAENCWRCHGPSLQTSDLRLDRLESILAGGKRGPAVVPGQPENSRLIRAIRYEDPALQMPPVGKLSDAQITDLTAWVAMGTPWPSMPSAAGSTAPDVIARKESHWAWRPLHRSDPPRVRNAAWPGSPIDRFILARLEESGIPPAPPADRRTLLRRVYFDLIGLPPDPAQVDAFVADKSENAYEKVVDSLLASPHFGERWARHWLDLVRYAETYGHEFDYPIRHAWRYRDYVIRAINADVPYDQFVTEHLAGDLLASPRLHPTEGTNESILGTGFWFFGQATHGPVDVRADEAERIDNQIDVMTKAFLGLTVACARCHDHKFDAITAADYYALAGFLQSSRLQHGFLDPHGKVSATAAELNKLHMERGTLLSELLAGKSKHRPTPIAPYLMAAHEVMYGKPRASDGPVPNSTETVLEGFEDVPLRKWHSEGDAFAQGPAEGAREKQKSVEGFRGKRLINSFSGDAATGSLVSDPFLIEQPFLRFLAGGRGSENLLSVRLRVDGRIARSAPVQQTENLRSVQWDLLPFIGRRAVLEIVDSDPDGHILVDHFVLSNRYEGQNDRRPVGAAALESEVDPVQLERWVQALQDKDPVGVFYAFHAVVQDAVGESNAPPPQFRRHLKLASEKAESLAQSGPYELFESFDDGHFRKWFVTGEAFGTAPTGPGAWNSQGVGLGFAPPGVAHSGLLADELQGALRSETFTITRKNIHYRLAGRGGRIRLIIDGYVMDEFNPLLFKGVSFPVNTSGRFVWRSQAQDVGNYIGHRAHIEILDDGDGYIAVDEIRFSDHAPPEAEVHPFSLQILGDSTISSREQMTLAYERLWRETLQLSGSARMDRPHQDFLDWMLRKGIWNLENSLNRVPETRLTAIEDAIRQRAASLPEPVRALCMADGSPEDEYVFVRGSYRNRGPVVPRRFLEAIDGADQPPIQRGSGRLDLARRMFDPRNPFPSRVLANRVWHHLFGRGLVSSPDNFGVLGEKPTHPELLDFLALQVRENGWSVKRLIRSIVTSKTYRMSSDATDLVAEGRDPGNILLHRMPVRRLEGEVIRDAILAISGRLDRMMYGPPVPIHLTPFMEGRGRPKKSGPLDGNGRRSIYQEARRNFLSPLMLAFDTPIPHSTIGRRTVSNVPAQALILMNDPLVVELARFWAKRMLRDDTRSATERIESLYETALSRPPTEQEVKDLLSFLDRQAEYYRLPPGDRQKSEELWADLCHVILNLKEFIFIR